eukprot:CAMPEP_0172548538 /NCGR_PEP_ID=MMETSP1067-20121228/17805_1 /TAXON_ID=265564 ORGANISM="Thalassiosira punctigera, Strain Tpunct2005C2" /NCGR_SAMPLE_ID=MMETSP1067 /ASSEMBLY_ACC=CAM_ASM_000444 /LENGTH=98 /DNA_ID=CAMNT_0013335765 /DNA_START=351 /DNA_END=642 /DNA_ORIENTATION=-
MTPQDWSGLAVAVLNRKISLDSSKTTQNKARQMVYDKRSQWDDCEACSPMPLLVIYDTEALVVTFAVEALVVADASEALVVTSGAVVVPEATVAVSAT